MDESPTFIPENTSNENDEKWHEMILKGFFCIIMDWTFTLPETNIAP